MRAWSEEQYKLEQEKYNPSRFRPDAIKRVWSEVLKSHGDPRHWQNGPMRRAAELPRLPMVSAEAEVPDTVEFDTFDYRYDKQTYWGGKAGNYRVHSVHCDGIRVWERIEKI